MTVHATNFMKTYKGLWEKFITLENFELAAENAVKGKSKQRQVIEFKKDWDNSVKKCRDLVASGNWQPSPYTIKTVAYPKQRDIYIVPFMPDRIIHHAIMNILKPIFTKLFIYDSYACIKGKGTLKASQKCSQIARRSKWIVQLDIKKFFPSISHDLMSKALHNKIKDERFMRIIDSLIYSLPGGKNLPIGNYTSQWFGNYFITSLDNYIKHTLKCHNMVRYCDDIIIGCDTKKEGRRIIVAIRRFLSEKLHLQLSYAEIYPVKQGIDFCGYRHFNKYNLLRKSTAIHQRKMINHIKKYGTDRNIKLILASIKGHDSHACTHNFIKSLNLKELEDVSIC